MQLFILRNLLIPSPTPLLGAKVLFGTVACQPQPIQLHEIIIKEMDPDVAKNSEDVLKLEVRFLGL